METLAHTVVINLRLSDRRRGTSSERIRLALLEADLAEALGGHDDMAFAGRDIGEGYCSLYCLGRDAQSVLSVVAPRLEEYPVGGGSYVELAYGQLTDPEARRRRIDLP